MHRFHVETGFKTGNLIALDAKESRHALTVLRVKPGEAVELLDGKGGVFEGVIASADKGGVKVSVSAPRLKSASRVAVTLAASVIKPERMELLIQKACELGVSAIVPLISERTVVRLSAERWKRKVERWRKIAQETCKQCGQARTPEIQDAVAYKKFAPRISEYDLCLIPTLSVPVKTLRDSLNTNTSARSVLVLIGPEGDFSDHEARAALAEGAWAVTLGPLVMRSETAALFSLAVVSYFYQENHQI